MKYKIRDAICGILTVIFAFVIFAGSMPAYAESGNTPGVDVILMLDQSGSMNWDNRDKERLALKMAQFFVKNLPTEDLRLGVYSFSTDVHEIFGFSKVKEGKKTTSPILKDIRDLKYEGDTDMGDAIETCAGIWDKIKKDAEDRQQWIVFMTDGEISFGNDRTTEEKEKIEDSHTRMNKALDRIDCDKCPIYVLAFGDEAVGGKDAKEISQRGNNRFIPARELKDVQEAYNVIFENILHTKGYETEGIVVDGENNVIPVNNDDKQNGMNVIITQNPEKGNGSALDKPISVQNAQTGEKVDDSEIEDYYDSYLGRLIKLSKKILQNGPLELVVDTDEYDVVDIKQYYLYDISSEWLNAENGTVAKGEEIDFQINVNGIDHGDFVVYAEFEKLNKSKETAKEVLPAGVSVGAIAKNVEIYGSSLDKKNLETFDGVKMLLDTQYGYYQTTASFNEVGDYRVHVYGENSKGFMTSDYIEFSVVNGDEPVGWKEKLLELLQKVINWYKDLVLWAKIAIPVGALLFIVIIRFVTSRGAYDDDDDDDDDDE